jgi:TorA-specific chaperone
MMHTTAAGTCPPLSAEHFQRQALLCQWLATLLARELDEPTLQAYLAGDAAPLLDWLAEDGLAAEARRLRQALATLSLLAQPRLELAADFATLFLGDARHCAAPYASCYLSERGGFMAEPAQRMAERLADAGVAPAEDFNEPADHLAVMLDYLAGGYRQLAETRTPAERDTALAGIGQFLRQELCSWLPAFSQRAARLAPASAFYPALAALTEAFCRHRLAEAEATTR